MGIEYYVAFSDVKDIFGQDRTSDIISDIGNLIGNNKRCYAEIYKKKASFSFSKENVPFIGEINVLKTNNKKLAEKLHTDLEDLKSAWQADMYVFPIASNKGKI